MGALLLLSAPRRSAAMALAVMVCVVCCAPSDVHAGIFFSLNGPHEVHQSVPARVSEGSFSDSDGIGSCGSQSETETDGQETDYEAVIDAPAKVAENALNPSSGGASAPSSSGWSVSLSAAALVPSVSSDLLFPRTYHHWRERAPLLANPPNAEILDPPKFDL